MTQGRLNLALEVRHLRILNQALEQDLCLVSELAVIKLPRTVLPQIPAPLDRRID
jgi:hypothetical protein